MWAMTSIVNHAKRQGTHYRCRTGDTAGAGKRDRSLRIFAGLFVVAVLTTGFDRPTSQTFCALPNQ